MNDDLEGSAELLVCMVLFVLYAQALRLEIISGHQESESELAFLFYRLNYRRYQ